MSLSLSTIKPAKGAVKKRKRVGRGNASGRGTYSGRGQKGQKARSGVSGLKRLGMKQITRRTPKIQGFKSLKPKNQVVNLSDLNKYYKEGEVVNQAGLIKHGLIKTTKEPVKILGKGDLKVGKLIFNGVKASESAIEQIKKNSGVIKECDNKAVKL